MCPDVVVVGSANLDVVLRVEAIPRPGETVLARDRELLPGGKGLNSAVAACRCGAATTFVAAVGSDDGAALLRDELQRAGVQASAVRQCAAPTGTAHVVVDGRGENAIVVDQGANALLLDLDEAELELVRQSRVLLCQLEVPLPTVLAAARAAQGLVVLNAAPAQPLPQELTDAVDVLVVNEHEALLVAGAEDLDAAVRALLDRVPLVLVTLGARGVLVATAAGTTALPAVPARQVLDTTGAGDTFCGAYAAARAAGLGDVAAAELAAAAASLSVEQPGASRSAPLLQDVQDRLSTLTRP